MSPRPVRLAVGRSEILDARGLYPRQPDGFTMRQRDLGALRGYAIHHDGAIMEPGDRDYSGSTLNEDLDRLATIYQVGYNRGWGGFPYHFVASPNGRVFYTCSVSVFGAHVARRNHELIGIALMGNFTQHPPGQAQLCAAGLALLAAFEFTGALRDVRGHREWALPGEGTVCPGNTWWTWQRDLLVNTVLQARLAFPER